MMSADVLLSLSPPSPEPDADPLSSSQARSRPPPRKEASIKGVKPSANLWVLTFKQSHSGYRKHNHKCIHVQISVQKHNHQF